MVSHNFNKVEDLGYNEERVNKSEYGFNLLIVFHGPGLSKIPLNSSIEL